jgi:hypothetical protein
MPNNDDLESSTYEENKNRERASKYYNENATAFMNMRRQQDGDKDSRVTTRQGTCSNQLAQTAQPQPAQRTNNRGLTGDLVIKGLGHQKMSVVKWLIL